MKGGTLIYSRVTNMEKVIMQDPKIYEQLGELTGRFNTFERNMAREFQELKQTIRDQSVVPYQVFEKHVLDAEQHIRDFDKRLNTIEDTLKIREATVTGKLAQFLDNAIVKIIGTGVVAAVLFAVFINYKSQIDSISNKVDNIDSQEQVIEQRQP